MKIYSSAATALSANGSALTTVSPVVDSYWAGFLGCEVDRLLNALETHLLARPNQSGLWAITRRGGWVVTIPALWRERLHEEIYRCFQPNLLPDVANLERLLHSAGDQQRYGPAAILLHNHPIGYQKNFVPRPQSQRWDKAFLDKHSGRSTDSTVLRPLTLNDHVQVAAFGASTPVPWSLEQPEIWIKVLGLFVAEQLVAACGVRVWGDCLAEIYVDTLPAHRRCGYGKAVTTAALQWIHTETPYQPESVVELSNQPSLQLMKSLGFEHYGYMVMSF